MDRKQAQIILDGLLHLKNITNIDDFYLTYDINMIEDMSYRRDCSDILFKILELYEDSPIFIDIMGESSYNFVDSTKEYGDILFSNAIHAFNIDLVKFMHKFVSKKELTDIDHTLVVAFCTCNLSEILHGEDGIIEVLEYLYTIQKLNIHNTINETFGYFDNNSCTILGNIAIMGLADVAKWLYEKEILLDGYEKTQTIFEDTFYLGLACIYRSCTVDDDMKIADLFLNLRRNPLSQDEKNEVIDTGILGSKNRYPLKWLRDNLGFDLLNNEDTKSYFLHVCDNKENEDYIRYYIMETNCKILDLFDAYRLSYMMTEDTLKLAKRLTFLLGSESNDSQQPYTGSKLIKTNKLGDFHLYKEIFKFI